MSFEEYLTSLQGKTVGVIGVGVSNRPLIEKLLERGIDVTARDKKENLGELGQALTAQGCKLRLGSGYLADLHEDVIFRTPGLRPDVPELAAAVAGGSVITSEMEAFFEVCPCPILAVTGSDGKTTTTTIISKLLAAEGKIVHVGGNIGHPLLCDTPEIAPEDMAVLELSSFQLMTMQKSPHIAVTTNLAPNHLDVHKDYQEYVDAKANIFTHQSASDIAVFNADNADTVKQAAKAVGEVRWFSRKQRVDNGVFCEDGVIYEAADGSVTPIMETKDILLPGIHNIENYMATFAAVRGLVSYETMRKIARTFGGVEHRIEFVRELDGVKWYNPERRSVVQRLHRVQPQPYHCGAEFLPGKGDPHRRGQGQGHQLCPPWPGGKRPCEAAAAVRQDCRRHPGGRGAGGKLQGLGNSGCSGLPRGGVHCGCALPAGGRGDFVPGQHLL